MHYVCIENGNVVGIQSYEPSVPPTVEVVTITDDQFRQIVSSTHKFDVTTKSVVALDLSAKEQERLNAVEREFLNSTDWKVLRHMRQKLLGIPTSLTEAQYLELEQQRQAAADRIV